MSDIVTVTGPEEHMEEMEIIEGGGGGGGAAAGGGGGGGGGTFPRSRRHGFISSSNMLRLPVVIEPVNTEEEEEEEEERRDKATKQEQEEGEEVKEIPSNGSYGSFQYVDNQYTDPNNPHGPRHSLYPVLNLPHVSPPVNARTQRPKIRINPRQNPLPSPRPSPRLMAANMKRKISEAMKPENGFLVRP